MSCVELFYSVCLPYVYTKQPTMPTALRLNLRLNLRLILAAIFVGLALPLALGTAISYQLGGRLQTQLRQLRLNERAALEHKLLSAVGARLAADAQQAAPDAGPSETQAFQQSAEQTTTVLAALRLQASNGEAHNLATDLTILLRLGRAAAAINTSDARRAPALVELEQALVVYNQSLERYASATTAGASNILNIFDQRGPASAFTLLATLAGGLSLLSLLYTVSAVLLRPLHALDQALAAVRGGELGLSLPREVPAEFAPLVTSYHAMTDALRQRQQALDEQLRRTSLLIQLSIELRETLETAMIAKRVLVVVGNSLSLSEATMLLATPNGQPQGAYRWRDGDVQPLEPERAATLLQSGVEGWAQRFGGSILLPDVRQSERWQAGASQATGSAIVLPLRQGALTLGSLTVYASTPAAFTNHDLVLLEGVIAQVGVALGAAQHYQDERLRREQAMALLTVTQALTVERSREELAALIEEQSQRVFQAQHGLLFLHEPDGTLRPSLPADMVPCPVSLQQATEAATAAATSGHIITVAAQPGQHSSCVALPLVHAARPIGACVLLSSASDQAGFSASLWSLLTTFTNIVAASCANIQLVEQLRDHASRLEALIDRRTEQLRRSRDLLRIIFDNLPEGLMLIDGEGTLLAANNAFCRSIVSRPPPEVVGQSYPTLWASLRAKSELHLELQGPFEGDASLLLSSGERFSPQPGNWRVLGTDLVGQQRWYAVERILVSSPDEPAQCLERWRDITQQEELQRRLLLHEQLTSLGRLAASVAHEVGNPLQSALGCLELCREDRTLSDGAREYLTLALGELDRMARTMESLRNLYRPPQLSWEPLGLNELVQQVARFTQRQLERTKVRLELDLDAELPPIVGQPDALRQVFLNLALNAQEAMPQGGSLLISTRRKDTDRLCQIVMRDSGTGIRSELLAHLFEPFRSSKAQGVGLGLYLCRQIVKQHGGQIELASQPGQGTTVTVLLPWSDAGPATMAQSGDGAGCTPSEQHAVITVEE